MSANEFPQVIRMSDFWKCPDCGKAVEQKLDVCSSCYYERDSCVACGGSGVRDVGGQLGPEPCPECGGEGILYPIPEGRCQSGCGEAIKHGSFDVCDGCKA